jgi:PadR family transcriptional regulator, regulatory protein PadR
MVTRDSRDLLYGSVDMLVLRTLSWDAMHGYAIASWIEQQTDGVLVIEDAALYKALHRLERQELVAGEWGTTTGNRRARFYRLTALGRKTLRQETAAWRTFAAAVQKMLEPPEPAR